MMHASRQGAQASRLHVMVRSMQACAPCEPAHRANRKPLPYFGGDQPPGRGSGELMVLTYANQPTVFRKGSVALDLSHLTESNLHALDHLLSSDGPSVASAPMRVNNKVSHPYK